MVGRGEKMNQKAMKDVTEISTACSMDPTAQAPKSLKRRLLGLLFFI
jgi:hypothetical protein